MNKMSKIIFLYEKNKKEMILEYKYSLKELLKKYLSLIDQKQKDILFMYKGKELSLQSNNIILNGNRNIISVINLNKKKNVNETNYILCPKCTNLQFLNINEEKISMTNCINNHKYLDLSINNFIKRQNELKINCSICNNNKLLYNNNFYICSCGKNICKLCRDNHNIKNLRSIK